MFNELLTKWRTAYKVYENTEAMQQGYSETVEQVKGAECLEALFVVEEKAALALYLFFVNNLSPVTTETHFAYSHEGSVLCFSPYRKENGGLKCCLTEYPCYSSEHLIKVSH